jgi:A/G-specific adenine glycosylase
MATTMAGQLLAWYQKNARELPWRFNSDPYAILVSEVMLQQTRVDTVIPYYSRWMDRFPEIKSLAEAGEDEVLRIWEGLGYYSRARNLHRAARVIMQEQQGRIPGSAETLKQLPGIGAYTAAAVASIAFAENELAVDANIRRVAARLFNLPDPLGSPGLETAARSALLGHLPAGKAGDFNQALMELGACICLPRQPLCKICPVQASCLAYQNDTTSERPVKPAKQTIPHYQVTAAVIWQEGQVLLAKRPASGLLGGMWEFPGGKLQPGETHQEGLKREIWEELGVEIGVGEQVGIFRHAYTHFKVTLYAYHCRLDGRQPEALEAQEIRWVPPADLELFPMGKIDRMIAKKIQ